MPSVAHIIRRRHNRKQRRRARRAQNRNWSGAVMLLVGLAVIVPAGVTLGLATFLYLRAAATLPTPAQTTYIDPIIGPTELYDRDGATLLYSVQDPLGNERRWLELDDLPPVVIETTLHMEDADYLDRDGFSVTDTLLRMWQYILGGVPPRDTTITGNLVRNALLPLAEETGLDPLLLETVYAAEIDRQYSARAALEWHLNTNDYGNDAYGIEAAAQVYLGKSASDLTLGEAALLAAIPLASQFNPFDNPTAALGRQGNLLSDMLVRGTITQAQYETASAQTVAINRDDARRARVAPTFAVYAREQVEDILDGLGMDGARMVARGGLTVITTLDMDLYYQSECAIRAHLSQMRGQNPDSVPTLTGEPCRSAAYLGDTFGLSPDSLPDQGGLLLLDALTGEIRAMTGPVTDVAQAPGPTLHPFVYLQGFLEGDYTPATMLLDIPQPFPGPAEGLIYNPINANGVYHGPMNLRDAMVSGLLVPAVTVADEVGLNRVLNVAHEMGVNTLEQTTYDLSLLERGGAVSLLDMTYAYSVFAADGRLRGVDVEPVARNFRARNPVAVRQIIDADGETIWQYDAERIATSYTNKLDSSLSYLINNILADHPRRASVLEISPDAFNIGGPAAVVNGLAGDGRDNWTVGYTPQLVLGVHLDRADDARLSLDVHGVQGATLIWNALMRYTQDRDGLQPADWLPPEGVAQYVVCDKSGLIPPEGSDCPRRTEWFLRARPPLYDDTFWQTFEVNSQTRLLASTTTPANLITRDVYFVPPVAALDWWRSNGLPLPPQEYDTLTRPEAFQAVDIISPADTDYVGGQVDIFANIDDPSFESYQLSYGAGLNPTEWINIGPRRSDYTPGQPVGVWDTSGLDQFYTLQLVVQYPDGSFDQDFALVTIDNVPPELTLQAGDIGQTLFRYPAESRIPIIANVQDNRAIDRVEFYNGDTLLGSRDEWPYSFNYSIQRLGFEAFRAVAYDNVGNSAEATIEVEIIRSGG